MIHHKFSLVDVLRPGIMFGLISFKYLLGQLFPSSTPKPNEVVRRSQSFLQTISV